jgi:hypothetical protein
MAGMALDKFAQLTDLAAELHSLTTQPPARGMKAVDVRNKIQDLLDKALRVIRWLKEHAGQAQAELGITGFTVSLGVITIAADFRPPKP